MYEFTECEKVNSGHHDDSDSEVDVTDAAAFLKLQAAETIKIEHVDEAAEHVIIAQRKNKVIEKMRKKAMLSHKLRLDASEIGAGKLYSTGAGAIKIKAA